MNPLELVIRIAVTLLVLLVMARLDGPRQVTQMNFYDYVIGIAVGSIAGSTCISADVPVWSGVTAIVLFLLSGILMSWLARKSVTLRRFLSGEPIVLIAHGEIQWKGLRRSRMNINELQSNLRYGGYFNIGEIEYAILEPTGKFSIQPKSGSRPPKAADLKLPDADMSLLANVVVDGKILAGNLRAFHKDERWLAAALKKQGYADVREVALATLDRSGALAAYPKGGGESTRVSLL